MNENTESEHFQKFSAKDVIEKINAENPVAEDVNKNAAENGDSSKSFVSPLKFFIIVVAAAVLIASGWHFIISPLVQKNGAQQILGNLANSVGDVTPANTELLTFTGQSLQKATVHQKSLGKDGKPSTPAGFYFTNGSGEEKTVVDLYGDFQSQRSRDFILMNRNMIQQMIQHGSIEFRFHPVPTGSAYSLYSAEALAESFITSPDKSWNFMLELFRQGANVSSDKNEDYLNTVANAAQEMNVRNVDGETIKSGAFTGWILSVGNDEKLQKNFVLPTLYVNGKQIDQHKVNLNNSDEVKKVILDG